MSRVSVTACAVVLCALLGGAGATANTSPVYVHMNDANHFLEPIIAVAPGQLVVFVSQDTGGSHTIMGYNPLTGSPTSSINGTVQRTAGAGHPVSTYSVRLDKIGVYAYYCPVHAVLAKTFGSAAQPAHRPGIDGFKGAMAGIVVVTKDAGLLRDNPPTTRLRVLDGFFGG